MKGFVFQATQELPPHFVPKSAPRALSSRTGWGSKYYSMSKALFSLESF